MEKTVTASSNRIYLDELKYDTRNTADTLRSAARTFYEFNIMAGWAYNRLYDQRVLGKTLPGTLTGMLKEESLARFGHAMNDYYAASVYTRASGMVSSQKKLQSMYDAEHKARQEHRSEKIQFTEEDISKKQEIKNLLVARSKAKKAGRPFDDSLFSEYKISAYDDGVLFRGAKNKTIKLPLYQYECMLDSQIRNLKTRAALISEKIKRSDSMHTGIPARATFGSKKQYRLKDTVCSTPEEIDQWHKGRNLCRFSSIFFSGRHTSKDGNFVCRYDPENYRAEITLMDGNVLYLPFVEFPYYGEELAARRLAPGHPSVSYSLEYRKDPCGREYFLLKASFPIANDKMNYYTGDGVISADLNYDRIAWSELNKDGCRIDGGEIKFRLDGLSSGEAKSILGKACKELIEVCESRHKPLVKEKLDINKTKLAYGNKKANRRISGFAYNIMEELILGQAFRKSVGVIEINPAYTSFLGKTKYMRQFGISIHSAASYVIGRRGMGFHERMPAPLHRMAYPIRKDGSCPNKNKKPFSAYSFVYKHTKSIPVSFWYQKGISFSTWSELDSIAAKYKAAHGAPLVLKANST